MEVFKQTELLTKFMNVKLRNMTSTYLSQNGKMLLLYRVGSRVVAPSWCGIGGHFQEDALKDPRAWAFKRVLRDDKLFFSCLT